MAISILLPKLGLTMQEGTIEEWVVAPGAAVQHGDVLLRLATDKVDVEVEAEGEGVFHPAVPAGVTLPPGTLIGWLLAPGERPPAEQSPTGANGETTPSATSTRPGRMAVSPNARRVAAQHDVDLALVPGTGPGGRIVSEDVEDFLAAAQAGAAARAGSASTSPLVRRYAESQGVDLNTVTGTGTGGRIRRADIDAVAHLAGTAGTTVNGTGTVNGATRTDSVVLARGHAPETGTGWTDGHGTGDATPGGAGQRIPLTGMRGTIARRMHASLQEAAQLTLGYEVRMDAVLSLRDRLKGELAGTDLPVPTLTDFVVRAAALALRDHPALNAVVRDDHIELYPRIHVGLAVAVPRGLMVPVIRNTADRSMLGLAQETRGLAEAARTGRLALEHLEGGTFAVTTLGTYGVDFFTPVINPGNVAILGVGRIRDGVAWEGDTPRRTQVLTLSLTFDHRAVDGAPAADYLKTVDALLQTPLRLLL